MTLDRSAAALLASGLALGTAPAIVAAQAASAPPQAAAASAAAAAAAQPANLFDFWIGDWKLSWLNADGTPGTGRNRITKILDGAAIQEDFETLTGAEPPLLKGRSLSIRVGGLWRQSWVDNQGGYFTFTAQVDGDKRVFITGPRPLKDGKTLLQRMIFHSITPTSLTWDWQSSIDGGQTWMLQWRALYAR